MEQIRTALRWLVANHFWVLSALLCGVGAACWWLALGDLTKQIAANTSTIENEFKLQQSLSSQPFLPNQDVNEVQTRENVALSKQISTLWETLYKRQREKVLRWPAELGSDFVNEVQDLKFGDWISDDLRDRYLNYIADNFPTLPAIIQAQKLDESQVGSLGGGEGFGGGESFRGGGGDFSRGPISSGDPDAEAEEYLVYWADQANVKSQLVWNRQPSTLRVWVTQENLWVYATLLRAIAATNEASGADRNSNAAVQQVLELQVGRDAAKQNRARGRLYVPESADGGLREGGEAAEGEERVGGGPDEELLEGGESTNEAAVLLSGRYLDPKGKPLTVGEPVDLNFGREYKQLPVRLFLVMDQRWVNRLVVELANAPLQVEVNEVRINPKDTESSGGGGGFGGRSGGGFDGGGGSPLGGAGSSEALVFNRRPNVVPVILQGIVYIFNEPDSTLLEVEGADEAMQTALNP